MAFDERDLISLNLLEFLRTNMKRGQEAQLAIHPESESVVVFIDDEPVLTCKFADLLAGPGGSLN